MADAVVSAVAQRLMDTAVELITSEVELLRDVEEEVSDLSNKLNRIRIVLDDAERRRFKDKSITDWLKRLEEACREMDDVLDEWDYVLIKQQIEQSQKHQVCSFLPSPSSCLCFKKVFSRHHIAKKIRVKAQLEDIFTEKEQFNFLTSQPGDHFNGLGRPQTTSLVEVEDICGRDRDREFLLSKFLVDEGGSQQQSGTQVISIVGPGGIGKTTLAQLIYNDSRVKDRYPLMIWICVSDPFDLTGIARGIVEKAQGGSHEPNQLDLLLERLRNAILGKKFILILDDVWNLDRTKWEPLEICLKCGAVGSKVLITTRNEMVAKMMGTMENEMHRVGVLSNEDCWLILSRIALFEKSGTESEKFKAVGKMIANKCKGLPLAAKTLGSLLRFKTSLKEWERILADEIWELEVAEVELFPHLILSYNELLPALKSCFSYCAILPKDSSIFVPRLIRYWSAQGYLGTDGSTHDMEVRGREYFNNLAMRSFFQDFYKDEIVERSFFHDFDKDEIVEQVIECKMHDIVHDFAQFLRKSTSNGNMQSTCQICNPALVSRVKEYRSLLYSSEPVPFLSICDCFVGLKVLALKNCRLTGVPKGIDKLIHLRSLDLSRNSISSVDDLKTICKLYNLRTLILYSCELREIPREIGNLLQLRELGLDNNGALVELPETICDLQQLQRLSIRACENLRGLPQGFERLINLEHFKNNDSLQNDQIVVKLPGLRRLYTFNGKFRYLKRLKHLRGYLQLIIPESCNEEDVDEARAAELNEMVQVDHLTFTFVGRKGIDEEWVQMSVLDVLKPQPNLHSLSINGYGASKLPEWITSPLNHVRQIELLFFCRMSRLPALGKLPCLEALFVHSMKGLEYVGGELLGITTMAPAAEDKKDMESSSPSPIVFPKLESLKFWGCKHWKEWEDITAEEGNSTDLRLFPCLKKLEIMNCKNLRALPHRLLHKATSLEELKIWGHCQRLKERYDKINEDSAWRSISHIPLVTFLVY